MPDDAATTTSLIVTTVLGTEAFAFERIVACVTERKNTAITSIGDIQPRLVFHGLAEVEAMMKKSLYADKQFIRCHRSCILNLEYCRAWTHDGKDALVRLTYGDVIEERTVSRTYKAAFVRVWTEFMQKR
jgi:hypothetical protein